MRFASFVRLRKSSFRIDDIYDDSVTRGGIPVMHSIYGFAHTINSINYTMANCIEKMLDMEEPRVLFYQITQMKLCCKLSFTDY
jgi:geranylgeranyl pyrophosphate synthase